ncbi:MAG: glycine cleavage system aminomethyltransferase GcvT [Dehalococcoidia bacterium]|jgi:aminomethyltransferase|tara:strand:- start:2490 stop:3608 length:1119 start_codon:yes stop_codon:yes gene_type:complete
MPLNNEINTTALFSIHDSNDAKFVKFYNYKMPLHYTHGILHEHIHTRKSCSIFDVSHMGQINIFGIHAIDNFKKLIPSDLDNLAIHNSLYTILTNESGGIIDDLIITKFKDYLKLVVNASNKLTVLKYLQNKLGNKNINMLSDHSLIAIQGPLSQDILSNFISGHESLDFMSGSNFDINKKPTFISRSGYTGEDGFEIDILDEDVDLFVRQLLDFNDVQLAGLGARDSLRIEAGLCLYGNELSEFTTPLEARISWVINKKIEHNDFPGNLMIKKQLKYGIEKIRTAIICNENFIIRKDALVYDEQENQIGIVSSGCYSPILKKSIAMAFIDKKESIVNRNVFFNIRGKIRSGLITTFPFVSHKYINSKRKVS